MLTEGTHSLKDSMVEGGAQRSSSPWNSNGTSEHSIPNETNSGHNFINPIAPVATSAQLISQIEASGTSSLQQPYQPGPSRPRMGQIIPSSIGIQRAYRAPNPVQRSNFLQPSQNSLQTNLHLRQDLVMERNYGSAIPVAPPAASRSIGLSLGSGQTLQSSNLATQLRLQYSSTRAQQPPIRQPFPMNPIGVANGVPPPIPVINEMANNSHFQPQIRLPTKSNQPRNYTSIFTETTQVQFRQVVNPAIGLTYYPSGMPLNQTQFPNTQQQGFLGFHSSSYEIGESSIQNVRAQYEMRNPLSRNVRMRMTTIQYNSRTSTGLHLGSSLNPIGQGNRNPSQQRPQNSLYDPAYEMQGLPIDPHLRLFFGGNQNHGNSNGSAGSN